LPKKWRIKAEQLLDSFISGLTVIRTFRQGAAVFALSVVHWTMMATVSYLAAMCFSRKDFDLGLSGAVVVQAVQALLVSLPQAPGFLGTHQLGTEIASKLVLGQTAEKVAKAYAITLWAVSVLPIVVLGFLCLWSERLTLRQVRQAAKTPGGDASG
jgi:hypothetical protein